MEELVKFLENVGVDNATIALLKDPEEGLKVEDLAEEFKSKQRDVYANDPDVIKELAAKAKGKERGSVERKIKKVFNISPDEWGENELEGDYEKALTFGFDKQKKTGSQSAQEITAELQDANKTIKWYKEDEIPRIEKESSAKVDRNEANRHLRKVIVDSGELIVSESATMAVVKEELTKKGYITGLNEGKTDLTIKTADGLSPQDEGKTRNLSNVEVVKGILESEDLIKQSNADPDPNKKKPIPAIPTEIKEKGFVHPNAVGNIKRLEDMNTSGNLLAAK